VEEKGRKQEAAAAAAAAAVADGSSFLKKRRRKMADETISSIDVTQVRGRGGGRGENGAIAQGPSTERVECVSGRKRVDDPKPVATTAATAAATAITREDGHSTDAKVKDGQGQGGGREIGRER